MQTLISGLHTKFHLIMRWSSDHCPEKLRVCHDGKFLYFCLSWAIKLGMCRIDFELRFGFELEKTASSVWFQFSFAENALRFGFKGDKLQFIGLNIFDEYFVHCVTVHVVCFFFVTCYILDSFSLLFLMMLWFHHYHYKNDSVIKQT